MLGTNTNPPVVYVFFGESKARTVTPDSANARAITVFWETVLQGNLA